MENFSEAHFSLLNINLHSVHPRNLTFILSISQTGITVVPNDINDSHKLQAMYASIQTICLRMKPEDGPTKDWVVYVSEWTLTSRSGIVQN